MNPHRTPGNAFGARRAWTAHTWGNNIFTRLASDIGFVCNSLAKETDWRCFIFSRRDILQSRGSSRLSVMCGFLFEEYRSFLCACIVLVDSAWCCLFFGTPHFSSIRAGDQSLMRVLLRFRRDDEEPPLVLVGFVVSRLYTSLGGLAVGFACKDCSFTSCAIAKGLCTFLLWLQAALRAEVFHQTQRIEGLKGQVVSAARFATHVQLPLMAARVTGKHFPRQRQEQ